MIGALYLFSALYIKTHIMSILYHHIDIQPASHVYSRIRGIMAEKKRVIVILTDDLHLALKRQAARRGATLSGLIRSVLGDWLDEQGDPVDWVVEWGGRREKTDANDLGITPTPNAAE